MSRMVEETEYLDTSETMAELSASKGLFHAKIRPYLHAHRFDGKRKPWYKRSDVLAIKTGKSARKASIVIAGMFGSWTAFAQSQYDAETELCSVEITTLPEDAVERFQLPSGEQFVKRTRLTRVGHTAICTWSTYYPTSLIGDILDDMKRGVADHVVEQIKEKHGLVIGYAKDVYSARLTTLDEQNTFQLPVDEPALILQRASFTRDKKTLVLYSDMVLLGDWFIHEHEYVVPIWDKEQ